MKQIRVRARHSFKCLQSIEPSFLEPRAADGSLSGVSSQQFRHTARPRCGANVPNTLPSIAGVSGPTGCDAAQSKRFHFSASPSVIRFLCLLHFATLSLSRYAFRSEEKVALQEIGPRFTLKLRWLKKGIPAVRTPGEAPKPLEFDIGEEMSGEGGAEGTEDAVGGDMVLGDLDDNSVLQEADSSRADADAKKLGRTVVPPPDDEFEWEWKPELETTRRTFFL
jgi:hypothetical protein